MRSVKIPWGFWYATDRHTIWFPEEWEIEVAEMRSSPSLPVESMVKALEHPIASPTLYELARGSKSAAITIDDMTRPTPGKQLLPIVIQQLEKAGLHREDITIFIGLGAHRPLIKQDMIKKLGEEIVSSVEVVNHNPYNDLIHLGNSKMGHPISINRRFTEKDLKVSIGCILPHPLAGFAGGAKNIIPGIGGIDTLKANHSPAIFEKDGNKYQHSWIGNPENPLRLDMEDIARKVGLSLSINVVINSEMEVAGLFAGDVVESHRAGCNYAREVYRTDLVPGADIVVLNAYPKDSEFQQIVNTFDVAGTEPKKLIRDDKSTIVLTTAASEGAGFHSLFGPGGDMFSPYENSLPPQALSGTETWIYSPNLSLAEIKAYFRSTPRPLFNYWDDLLSALGKRYTKRPLVAVYPLASIQMGYG